MSVMSDVFVTITEGLEQGTLPSEIAYQLTCEYPSMTIPLALDMIGDVMRFESTYSEEANG